MTRPDFQAPDLRPLIEALDLAIAEYDKAIAAGRTTTALLTIGRASLLTMRETVEHLVEDTHG